MKKKHDEDEFWYYGTYGLMYKIDGMYRTQRMATQHLTRTYRMTVEESRGYIKEIERQGNL